MKKNIKTLSLLLVFVSILSCKKNEVSPINGETATDFSLKDLSGNTVKLSDYKNKVVVLFFFGNTCPSCKSVGPTIQSKLANAYAKNTDFVILGLDQWDGDKSSVTAFKNITGITFPLLLDASSTSDDYKTVYDRLIVIDKSGFIRFRGTQVAANDLNQAISTVDQYLK